MELQYSSEDCDCPFDSNTTATCCRHYENTPCTPEKHGNDCCTGNEEKILLKRPLVKKEISKQQEPHEICARHGKVTPSSCIPGCKYCGDIWNRLHCCVHGVYYNGQGCGRCKRTRQKARQNYTVEEELFNKMFE